MFGNGSPLSAAFWTSPNKPSEKPLAATKKTSKTGADIDLKRLSIFKADKIMGDSVSPTSDAASTVFKENSAPANGNDITHEQNVLITNLMEEMKKKDALIAEMHEDLNGTVQKRTHRLSQLRTHIIHDEGRLNGLGGVRIGRSGSILTQNVLEAMEDPTKTGAQVVAESLIRVFQTPTEHIGLCLCVLHTSLITYNKTTFKS